MNTLIKKLTLTEQRNIMKELLENLIKNLDKAQYIIINIDRKISYYGEFTGFTKYSMEWEI